MQQLPSEQPKTLSKRHTGLAFLPRGSSPKVLLPPQLRDQVLLQILSSRTSAQGAELYTGTPKMYRHRGLCWRKAQIELLGYCKVQRETGRQRSDEIIH